MRKTKANDASEASPIDTRSTAEKLVKIIESEMRKDPNRKTDDVKHLDDLDFLASEILKMRKKFHKGLADAIPPNITREAITGRSELIDCDVIIHVVNEYFDTRTAIGIQDCLVELEVAAIVAQSCCLMSGDSSLDGDGLISTIYSYLIKSEITDSFMAFIADEAAIEGDSIAHEISVEPRLDGNTKRIWMSVETFDGLEIEGWAEDVRASVVALLASASETRH